MGTYSAGINFRPHWLQARRKDTFHTLSTGPLLRAFGRQGVALIFLFLLIWKIVVYGGNLVNVFEQCDTVSIYVFVVVIIITDNVER